MSGLEFSLEILVNLEDAAHVFGHQKLGRDLEGDQEFGSVGSPLQLW